MIERKKNVAFFAGLSAFIAVAESLIIPIPFFRLGISNIPVCIAFEFFNFFEVSFIVFFKLIFSHLFRGTIFSYPFLIGLAGNTFFLLVGYLFYAVFKKLISFISISMIGAISHSIGQLLMATLFIPIKVVYYLAIPFIFVSLVLGFINGIICNISYNKLFVRLKL